MTRRSSVGYIYFAVMLMALLLRISSALDVYSALNVDPDTFFSCIVQILIFGVMPLALYYFAVARREQTGLGRMFSDFGVRKIDGKDFLLAAAIAVCAIVIASGFSYAWQFALQLIGFTHVSSPTDYGSIGVLIREIVIVAVLPATFEELSHRGLLYAGYKESGWRFVIVSALFFSLMHQNIVQTGYTFIDGLVIALMMYYTGSIFPGMMLHFTNNFYSVFTGYVEQNGGPFNFINIVDAWLSDTLPGIIVSIVAFVVCACLLVVFLLMMRRRAVKCGRLAPEPFFSPEGTMPLYKDIPFWLTVALGLACAAFSFAWGMIR